MNSAAENNLVKGIPRFLLLGLFFLLCTESKSQTNTTSFGGPSEGSSKFQVTPRIFGSETWSNNISLQDADRKSGWITEVSPGIRIDSSAGRVKGYLDYSLHQFAYSNKSGSGNNSLQNALASSISMEIVDNWAFLDLNGNISQQTTSAFGSQSSVDGVLNSNKTEVSTYSVSPYIRGRLSSWVDYEARYSSISTKAKENSSANSNQNQASFKLNGDELYGRLRWSIDGSRQETERTIGQNVQADNLNLTLTYSQNRQLSFYGIVGREVGNYISNEKESSRTSGGGVNWAPDETTKISADMENKLLGRMHKLGLEHRTPRTSWRIGDTKSVSVVNSQSVSSAVNSNYDILYSLFSSIEPDPIKRAQMVRDFLQSNGLNSNSSAVNGYITSGTSVQRVQDLSFALLGIRDTVTFTATRSTGKRVGDPSASTDDFSSTSTIRQDGFSTIYSHKLTPDSVINAQFSLQNGYGETSSQDSKTKSVNINLSSKVGLKTFATIGARHVISSGNSSPYKETAIIGSLMVQF